MSQDFDLIIEAGKAEREYWKDLWRFRELFYFLAWRDILVRYKQTVIGILWSVLRPFLTMIAFVIVFQKVAKLDSPEIPYPLLVFSGLLPWQLFSTAISEASGSLISNANMVSKVYFPRIIIPISSIIVAMVDFLISFAIFGILCLWYGFAPSSNIIYLPFFFFLVLLISAGVGVLLAALNVKYRDFRYVVPFIVQFGLYISPVGFDSVNVPENWRFLYGVNPMVGVIDGFRWCLFGKGQLYPPSFMASLLIIMVFTVLGLKYFRATEKTFADRI